MSDIRGDANTLVMPANFIRAIRESGYLTLSTALAELVDNSLQANAHNIDININRDAPKDIPWISVEDDGCGMAADELADCLRFGGSARFNSRSSLGRFGMGLPAASLSQARRVEVTGWQQKTSALKVQLDVDAIVRGDDAAFHPRIGTKGAAPSGCRVVWHKCDRIKYQRLGWLRRSLHKDLGRMFRKFLQGGLRLRIDGRPVEPVDPMMLSTKIGGHSADLAFEPLHYEISTSTGESSFVTVTFAMLPVGRWHCLDNAAKRRAGITGQGGVSVLRAGREIANGWYLMGSKRKENYDDWWRCEVEFDPALDDCFGITINKQGVRPTDDLRLALEPDLESIAHLLNTRVRHAFEHAKFEAAVQSACRIATIADAELPAVHFRGETSGALSYQLEAEQLPGETMFDLTLRHRCVNVTMNTDHPGFAALYRPLQEMGESGAPVRTALELLLLSFGRSLAATGATERDYHNLLQTWGTTYGRMLQKS